MNYPFYSFIKENNVTQNIERIVKQVKQVIVVTCD